MDKVCLLQHSDLAEVNQLLANAFSAGRKEDGYAETYVPKCNPTMLAMYLSACPDGCFSIKQNGDIIATAFSHVWGSTGWIGPIAVKPSHRGKSYGQLITQHCIEFLKAKKCLTIGLETMPRSYRNLGFYLKLGFRPQQLTYELAKYVPESKGELKNKSVKYKRYSIVKKRLFLKKVGDFVTTISSGIDYSSFIKSTDSYNFGESLLFEKENRPFALVITHIEPYSVEEKRNQLRICLLVTKFSSDFFDLSDIFTHIENLARKKNLKKLFIRVPANYWLVTRWLLNNQFKIFHSDLRMTLDNYPEVNNPGSIHLNRWE